MELKEMIAVMQAFCEGKKIAIRPLRRGIRYFVWEFTDNPKWDWLNFEYKVIQSPKEVYVNEYAFGVGAHLKKEDAMKFVNVEGILRAGVKYREVIEDEQ